MPGTCSISPKFMFVWSFSNVGWLWHFLASQGAGQQTSQIANDCKRRYKEFAVLRNSDGRQLSLSHWGVSICLAYQKALNMQDEICKLIRENQLPSNLPASIETTLVSAWCNNPTTPGALDLWVSGGDLSASLLRQSTDKATVGATQTGSGTCGQIARCSL